MVHRDHAVWRVGHIACVLLMDIKEAFPTVGHGRLIHTKRGKGMEGDLSQLTGGFLTHRMVELVI